MISKSFNNFFGFLIIILFSTVLNGEEKIDIWKNKNEKKEEISQTNDEQTKESKIDFEKILNDLLKSFKRFYIYRKIFKITWNFFD